MSEILKLDTVDDRLERVRELEELAESCKKQLDCVFEALGWSADHTREPMGQCPFDPNHRVPVRTMERHKKSCELRGRGYSDQEQAAMVDPSVCYENTSVRTLILDKATQHQVIQRARAAAPMMKMEGVFWQGQFSGHPIDVPETARRWQCDLTAADRLALYDHVTGRLGGQLTGCHGNDDLYVDLVSKLQKGDDQSEPKSHLELMAEMRDYKRRRQSYRAKNVHITKKSYTEVIREVIKVHSGELSRQWREEEEEEEEEKEEGRRRDDEEEEEEKPRSKPEPSSHRRLDERRSPSTESRLSHKRHRSSEKSPERERGSERERGRKKRKRDRESRSPDDRRHERKKKKKKKREDRDKDKEREKEKEKD